MTIMRIAAVDLQIFSANLFKSTGMKAASADITATSLVEADLRGIYSHGVVRLQPVYMKDIREGRTNPNPDIKVAQDSASHALLEGDRGQGQVVAHHAMSLAIKKASDAIIGVVGVKNSRHFGAAAHWSLMATEASMIGFSCSNGSLLSAAPFGGAEGAQGNMPMSYAIPNGNSNPVVLDMATGEAAMGKVEMARLRGDPIPIGWAIDKQGLDTTDPNMVTAVLPAGGAKGYSIGVVLDVLAGTLTGSLPSAIKGLDTELVSQGNQSGHFFMAINIEGFIPPETFAKTMKEHSKILHDVKPRPGFKRVNLPGELEWLNKEDRLGDGIPFQEQELSILEDLGSVYGIEPTW